jgi:transposase-like protein
VPREQEAGLSTAEVCRKHGISTATFYAWKAKFGGMDVSEAKRLKQLEDENAKLKRLSVVHLRSTIAGIKSDVSRRSSTDPFSRLPTVRRPIYPFSQKLSGARTNNTG